MTESPALTANGVTKRFGNTTALANVSVTVHTGECVALVGESGSGKTTLLRCFNRMVVPDSGTISVSGRDLETTDPVRLRRQIGYVPQDGGLLPHWSVIRNVALVPWLNRSPNAENSARHALALVGLPAERFADRHPSQLSGGQRQRVAIARALAAQPLIVLLDEPFGALDAITRAELQEVFRQLRVNLALSALLVTHDLNEAALLADRLAVLRAGAIEQIGSPAELLDQPATPYVRELALRARLRRS